MLTACKRIILNQLTNKNIPHVKICNTRVVCHAKSRHVIKLSGAVNYSRNTSSSLGITDQEYVKTSLVLSRLMGPDDANQMGNVHGGNILSMIEEAGAVAATRYCNEVPHRHEADFDASVATLARIEKVDFNGPVYIGEVAEVHADITFTSARSLLVIAKVYVENILTGKCRLTNEAHLWYVPVSITDASRVMNVPALQMTKKQYQHGHSEYTKTSRQRSCAVLYPNGPNNEAYTVGHSQTVLTRLINPSDLAHHGYCKGGIILKLMDECAAITAGKHCKGPTVTASMDATNFLQKSRRGALLTFYGHVTHASSKSMEVQVLVEGECPFIPNWRRYRAVESYFVFVALDENRKVKAVPPIKLKMRHEILRYESAEQRYHERNAKRKLAKQSNKNDTG